MTNNTTQRGYGWQHQKERARWKPKVDTGQINCARCHTPIHPNPNLYGDGWQLDHNPTDRTKYNGPTHTSCNQGGAPPPTDPNPTPTTDWT